MLELRASLRRRTLQAALLLACFVPAASQAPTPTQEISTHDSPAIFSAKVNLVSVPVVVRDRQGRAVGNLKVEDFELSDLGKPQLITRFAVDKSGVPSIRAVAATNGAGAPAGPESTATDAAPPLPERFVIYVFDDLHLKAEDLLRVRAAAQQHLNKTLESTARAAIYTTSGFNPLDFTDDRGKLTDALNAIHPSSLLGGPVQSCPDIGYYQADMIVNQSNPQALAAATADAQSCSGITDASALSGLVQGAAHQNLRLGEIESVQVLDLIKSAIQRLGAAPGSRSLVLISPGFFLTQDRRSDEGDLIDKAVRANVAIATLDARGLYTFIPGGDASQRGGAVASASARDQFLREAALADGDILGELADATGGKYFHNDNGLEEGLNEVAARPEYIYVLGFSPQNLKYDGAYHRLKVTIKDKGLQAQARRGYYAPKHATDPAEQAKEEIREAVFSRDELRDLGADLNLQFFKTTDTNATISVLTRVDLSQLKFQKADDRNKNTLTIVASVFDTNGNYVAGTQKIVDLNLKDQTLAKLPAGGITVRTNFEVAAQSSYAVRLVVRDSEGQTMAARNGSVKIP